MRFDIRHELHYRYSSPVFLEPHTLFLRPREDAYHRLHRFEITIDPVPSLSSPFIDTLGNPGLRLWFQSVWDHLDIRVLGEVEVTHVNPFDYFLEDPFQELPARYTEASEKALAVYFPKRGVHPSVQLYSGETAREAGGSTGRFLTALCQDIYSSFERIQRPDGGPWPAEKTLSEKAGACRDLTVLYMECCRAQGLAARFTSGYYCNRDGELELHAWPEVFIEGGGWRGFDPSAGLTCAELHVPLASSFDPRSVSPVQGSFRGSASGGIQTMAVEAYRSALI